MSLARPGRGFGPEYLGLRSRLSCPEEADFDDAEETWFRNSYGWRWRQ